jgi:phosphopantothenoylcysteine decarboxylase
MAKIALGVTGSVAAIRVPPLVAALRIAGHDARVVVTEPSLYFFDPASLPAADVDAGPPLGRTALFRDADEWPGTRYQRDDPVLHIELRRWADLLLIAPLDANTLAKLAHGLSDNLLTCLYRAWDPDRPIVLAPAMNTFMWEHPLTEQHLAAVQRDCPRLRICLPQTKRLACGDVGMGAMAEVEEIVATVTLALTEGVLTMEDAD